MQLEGEDVTDKEHIEEELHITEKNRFGVEEDECMNNSNNSSKTSVLKRQHVK